MWYNLSNISLVSTSSCQPVVVLTIELYRFTLYVLLISVLDELMDFLCLVIFAPCIFVDDNESSTLHNYTFN